MIGCGSSPWWPIGGALVGLALYLVIWLATRRRDGAGDGR